MSLTKVDSHSADGENSTTSGESRSGESVTVEKEPARFISTLRLKNFKSYRDVEVNLENLSVLIGRNASGKSNFVDLFRFLKDLATLGLSASVQLHGSGETLAFTEPHEETKICLEGSLSAHVAKKHHLGQYSYQLRFRSLRKGSLKILSEELTVSYDDVETYKLERNSRGHLTETDSADTFRTFNIRGKKGLPEPSISLLQVPLSLPLFVLRDKIMNWVLTFDFTPRLSKVPATFQNTLRLEEDGSNLSSVLWSIFKQEDKKRSFMNNLRYVLEYISDVSIEQFGHSMFLTARENYSGAQVTGAHLSDGTLHVIALITAIKYQRGDVIVIEEPERYVHPTLLRAIISLIREELCHTQFILTTHSPPLWEIVEPDEVFMVERDHRGHSRIQQAMDSELVQTFLENDLTLGDLMETGEI